MVVLGKFLIQEGTRNLSLIDTKMIVTVVEVILVIAMLAGPYLRKLKRTTADLHEKFAPEFGRAVQEYGSEPEAEAGVRGSQETG